MSAHRFVLNRGLSAVQRGRDRRRAVRVFGKSLGRRPVHHHSATQLVICEDRSYHYLLHQRTLTLRAGGNPNTQRYCQECKTHKPYDQFGDGYMGLSCITCCNKPSLVRGRLWAWTRST